MKSTSGNVSHPLVSDSRRSAIRRIVSLATLATTPIMALTQAPPPPPPVHQSMTNRGLLATSTEIVYSIRRIVDLERDETAQMQQLVAATIDVQRRLLGDYGIDPDSPPSRIRLSNRDARQLDEELDEVLDLAVDEAKRFLSHTQTRAFHDVMGRELTALRTAISTMRR